MQFPAARRPPPAYRHGQVNRSIAGVLWGLQQLAELVRRPIREELARSGWTQVLLEEQGLRWRCLAWLVLEAASTENVWSH